MINHITPHGPPLCGRTVTICMLIVNSQNACWLLLPGVDGAFAASPARAVNQNTWRLSPLLSLQAPNAAVDAESLLPLIEDALKRLYDLAYLANHPLTDLQLVRTRVGLSGEPITSLTHAKALGALLTEMVELLRPSGSLPGRATIPRREWHSYLILQRAYMEGEHNYVIMNWLQIGEGTFNRARRRALQALASVIAELEERHKLEL